MHFGEHKKMNEKTQNAFEIKSSNETTKKTANIIIIFNMTTRKVIVCVSELRTIAIALTHNLFQKPKEFRAV